MQDRISSADFAEWCAFLIDEPDIGRRADGLATVIGALIGRVEAALGGKPPRIESRLIEWGGKRSADEQMIAKAISEVVKRGECTARN